MKNKLFEYFDVSKKVTDHNKRYICYICNKSYGIKGMKSHVIDHYNIGGTIGYTEIYKCVVCNKQYITDKGFINHVLNHQNTKEHDEKICKINKISKITKRPEYVCQICNKKYISRDSVRSHAQSCSGFFFKCTLCASVYKYKSGLWKHNINNHINPGPIEFKTDAGVENDEDDEDVENDEDAENEDEADVKIEVDVEVEVDFNVKIEDIEMPNYIN